jgi:hypothetical protein
MQSNLYLCNGKDFWLIPKFKNKKIILVDVQSKLKTTYPFLTQAAAKENYNYWLDNQEQRLPKTFMIRSRNYDHKVIALLKKLGIKKEKKADLRKYLFYHKFEDTYNCAHIDDEYQDIIPIINYMDLKRITAHQDGLTSRTIDDFTPKEGLFAHETV